MNAQTISEAYRVEQQQLHRNPRYGVASIAFAPVVRELIRAGRCRSLSDYGAGKCNLLRALKMRDLDYFPYDPAYPEYGPPRPAELVTCIDVLEHVEPELLDACLDQIASITERLALLTVHTGPAKKHLSDGRNAHLTQQPASWWLPRIEQYFDVIHLQQVKKGFFLIVCRKGLFQQLERDLDAAAISRAAGRHDPRTRSAADKVRKAVAGAWTGLAARLGREPGILDPSARVWRALYRGKAPMVR